jgi:cob(I)alamin adenosyltransferase
MKIYTGTGDQGETGLLGGIRVRKSHRAVEVCGNLDETNSLLGMAIGQIIVGQNTSLDPVHPVLITIQNELFDLGSRVAACQSDTSRVAGFSLVRSQQLEAWIDHFDSQLPPLREFILPGGGPLGGTLHHARTVCRRSERSLVVLMEQPLSRDLSAEMIYLNRLGDLLFVLARYCNQAIGVSEHPWQVTPDSPP